MTIELKTVLTDPEMLLMTGFGAGLVPKAPGTVGSLVGALLFFPALFLPIYVQLGIIVIALGLGIVFSQRVADELEIKDPAMVVWDEFVGMWIAMLWLPGLPWLPIALVVFRLFDIVKPWPVSWADRELDGGLGIMIDDVIAGLMTLAVLQLVGFFVVTQ